MLRFFFALSGILRVSCIPGLADRPLCLALAAGFCSSDMSLAVPMGIFFELFWLDRLELGNVVSPSGALSLLLLFPLAGIFSLRDPAVLAVPLICVLPLACVGAFVERRLRVRGDRLLGEVVGWTEGRGGISPETAVRRACLLRAGTHVLLYLACFTALFFLFRALAEDGMPAIAMVNWPMLHAVALMGAVLSLRTKQSYIVLIGGLAALVLMAWV